MSWSNVCTGPLCAAMPWVTMRKNRPLGGTCALALQAALLAACMGTEPRSLGMCTSIVCWLAGVALTLLFSVGLILNDLEPNHKGRSSAAVAWLKQSDSQGHGSHLQVSSAC